jgi:hypothetical protein
MSTEGAVSVRIEPVADVSGERFRPTHLMERVSRFLESATVPASQTTIEHSVEGKVGVIRQAVDVLVSEGFVERSAGPRSALLHSIVRPFREVAP